MQPKERLITVTVPEGIYNKLKTKKIKEGVTIQHHVNAILALYFFGKKPSVSDLS
jgi:predicted DNA binding CopG/RHH family protein